MDHTSPLSISLASSESLSISLRSVTEIRNLHSLVSQPPEHIATTTNILLPSLPQQQSQQSQQTAGRQPVSEDIPVPGPSQHHHIHYHLQK